MIDYYKTRNLIEQMIPHKIVPGVNYAFIKGEQVNTATLGFASIYPQLTQLSPFGLYDLASLTKVIGTTNVFLKLYEEGRINFSEPLKNFLPEFKDERVRLSHLLTHTSGIKGWIENRDQLSAPELLKAIVNLPVTDEFETKMRYADTNFILLGLVLERIYHEDVQTIITNEVIKPLGLENTTFTPPSPQSIPTAFNEKGEVLQGIVHDPKARILGKDCGSAGLFSTLDDLLELAKYYLGIKKDEFILKQDTVAQLFDSKSVAGVHPRSWGWDLRFDPKDNHPLIYHTGFTGTFMLLDRQKKSGMIVLTNRIHPTGKNEVFLSMREKIVQSFLAENSK
ncbi:serine hydrolase domain-containing protein [Lactobacillus sp. PV012]|uniref:serine hydrolase domain-containing protein n=1 Tax=Lactobacillus sp. PV012 TaxID=2594494 RepID=UPI00223F528B|nr:serine hydrolase domain-containing protein [Lactobacillus sp. PV012]QNQ82504.1 beta-lactamase family protein [Lactobacillus sp. PV012]